MKKLIVLASMMVFSVAFFSGCDSKGKKCGALYDKAMTCVKDAKMTPDKDLGSKDKFVGECKKNWKEAQELMKMECKDLVTVFGDEPEEKPAGDMPADMPAEDMPADMPAADAPPADMPAADAPPADMPAADAPPAEDMK